MEIFYRLKALIPTVRASEVGSDNSSSDASQTSDQGTAPGTVEVTDTQSHKVPHEKEPVDLTLRPEVYSDILVEGDPQYEYYPEREFVRYQPKFLRRLMMLEGREEFTRVNCERKLYEILTKGEIIFQGFSRSHVYFSYYNECFYKRLSMHPVSEPLIKLLVGALESSGCPINIRRNFSCEVCYKGVLGGYDTETQQVVMCMNNVKKPPLMATILAHELIHMFDHCVNKTDFKSPAHLACTEIRAVNLTSCSLIDSFWSGYVSLSDVITQRYEKKHAVCVKDRALKSVLAASTISEEEARKVIDTVFPYCYNDLEPIGRRLRHKTEDGDRAFRDGQHYGYV